MILRTGATYLVARIVPGALGVATTALLTRLLSPDVYGVYGLALIVMNFASTVAFEWLGMSFMRFFESRKNDPRTVPTFLMLFAGLVGLTGLLLAGAMSFGLVPAGMRGLFAVGMLMAWSFALFEMLAKLEIAAVRPVRYLLLNLLRAVALSACTLLAAFLSRDALWTAAGTAAGLALAVAPMMRQRLTFTRQQFDVDIARQVIRFGLPFAVSMLLAGLFTSGVRSLVAVLAGPGELGFYTAAYNLAQNVLAVIASAVGSATYPLAVRAFERGDPAGLQAQLEENFTLLISVIVPASLGMALTAPDLAHMLVGPGFQAPVAMLMPPMCLTVLLGALRGTYLDHSFQLGKRIGAQVAVSAVAAALALGGTALLVPAVGVVGAPIATTFAMAVSCVHAWLAGRRGQPMPLPAAPLIKVAAAAGAMAVAVLAIPTGQAWSLCAKVLAGGTTYAAVCLATDMLGVRAQVGAMARRHRQRFAG